MPAYDLLVAGAAVYDGTGASPVVADVGVAGDRIAAVGDLTGAAAGVTVDGRGLAVAPGFIDVHSHDDAAVLADPLMRCKVLQGVTTDVVGNCGMGAAPYAVAARAFHTWSPELADVPVWEGYGGYLAQLDEEPASLNVAALIGHGAVREAVLGTGDRAPSARDLDAMRGLVSEGLDAGAVGFSTGLIYEPGRYAATEEIITLAAEAAGSGALYATHMRNEADGLLDAVAEALRIGEEAGVPVQISHHKAAGRANWGRVQESLAMVHGARDRGVEVTLDQYPYTAGSTLLFAIVQNGGLDGGGGGMGAIPPEAVTVASATGHPEWEGLHLGEIGAVLGVSPREAADAVLAACPQALIVAENMSEDDVRTVMSDPLVMIGSDGIPAPGKPHPRLWGTFPRVLGHYARDEGVLTMAEAVRRMTGLPAATFGLTDRGVIREGAFADLVVFDPARVIDVATYADPARPPLGIVAVVVNGTVVVRDGEHTGARPGRALRRAGV